MISLFVSQSTLGLGTIIGSEVFNHLIISAACILACNPETPLKLDEMAFTREVACYALTMIVFMWALQKGSFERSQFDQCLSVCWFQGFILMMFYVGYALLVVYYKTIFPSKYSAVSILSHAIEMPTQVCPITIDGGHEVDTSIRDIRVGASHVALSDCTENAVNPMHTNKVDVTNSTNAIQFDASVDSNSWSILMAYAEGFMIRLTYPLKVIISRTIVDVTIRENRIYYPITAVVSMVWLGLLAEIMLECITLLGDLLDVSPVIMGLTIGAWGASMPTLWSSVVVARRGLGDMAISNALGANVFSILVGLGLPWFLYPLYIKKPYDGIKDGGILPLSVIMILIILAYYILVRVCSYILQTWMAYLMLTVYIVIIVMCVVVFKF